MNDDELIAGFESAMIPAADFNHRAHVRTAYLVIRRYGAAEALPRFRAGLQALNALHGAPDELERGYHETITVAFLTLIAAMIDAHGPGTDSQAFCEAHPHLLTPRVLRLYYTRDRIVSWTAKREFVSPDLAPLPRAAELPSA